MPRIAGWLACLFVCGAALSSCAADDPLTSCPGQATTLPSVVVPADASLDHWVDAADCTVRFDVVASHAGPAACGWELVHYITVGDPIGAPILDDAYRAYHWDPVNHLAYVDGQTRNRTVRTADLPATATDTGFRRGSDELWFDPATPQYLYLTREDQVRRYLLDAEGVVVCPALASRRPILETDGERQG